MSEYQYVAFRAIDRPVSGENLDYMRRQSSRAEVTPWTFDNEYHFGDFRGNAVEMLRRGYDLHLHYANFGIRKLMIRLPYGLPNPKGAKPYLGKETVKYVKDSKGPGGILSISPVHEVEDLNELSDIDEWIEQVAALRTELLDGDLRPLYLAHLIMASDMHHDPEETTEGPLPAGLDQLTDAQKALAEMYDLDDALLAAAACRCPPMPARKAESDQYLVWLESLPVAAKNAWLARLLAEPQSTVRAEILVELRKSQADAPWPAVRLHRTVAELKAAAEEIRQEAGRKVEAKAARERAAKVAAMKADPKRTLGEVDKLVAGGGTPSYRQAATLLAELQAALEGTTHAGAAEKEAQKLKKKYPSRNRLFAELRRAGVLA